MPDNANVILVDAAEVAALQIDGTKSLGLEIFDFLVGAIREETECGDIAIHPNMTMSDFDGWDSLAHERIVINLGVRIGQSICFRDACAARTIGDLAVAAMNSFDIKQDF